MRVPVRTAGAILIERAIRGAPGVYSMRWGTVRIIVCRDAGGISARFDERGNVDVKRLDPGEFTQLLVATREGDGEAWTTLVRMVYGDLRRLARRHVLSVSEANTLGTTGLVNECYLRMVGPARANVENRRHFLNLASRVMRQVLCDYAREQLAAKRGGSLRREQLGVVDVEEWAETEQLVLLDDALRALEQENERMARVFECRYFAGLTDEESAETLGLSLRTVQRDWHDARTWLAERLA